MTKIQNPKQGKAASCPDAKFDGFVKSPYFSFFVIPAKAGIQVFLDPGSKFIPHPGSSPGQALMRGFASVFASSFAATSRPG
ncbi:MAG: hypothetical protein K9L59_16585 [Desulfobacterales bacterium]|nr:hypothetical protein [Desulfobacterales bacterium]